MNAAEKVMEHQLQTLTLRLKFVERDCPRCDAVIIKNEKEECYECPKCGFIDCGTNKQNTLKVSK